MAAFELPSNVTYTDPGGRGYFGIKDLDELSNQGLSLRDIASFAFNSKNAPSGVGRLASQIFKSAGYTADTSTTEGPTLQDLMDDLKIQEKKNQDRINDINTTNQTFLNNFKIQNKTRFDTQAAEMKSAADAAKEREIGFQNSIQSMQQQQLLREQQFQQKAADQQRSFDTAQRVSASNVARGGQQTDYRLGPAANAMRGGTAGFRRRSKQLLPQIGAAGFTTANNKSAKMLNV